jgi:hypothetical protein
MNIVIAGLVGGLILLVGGPGYYKHFIAPEMYRKQMLRQLAKLDQTESWLYIIRTEEQLNAVLNFKRRGLRNYAIALDTTLTEQRVVQILQEHDYDDSEITDVRSKFIS